ncbi:MAG: uridylate kinase [Methanotrichaceae archaeon]|nr:uridylate kinase [Methanotrichaceae archaeon]
MPFYVLKLGGSLINVARELMLRLQMLIDEDYSFLVVPGGGPMANLVRDLFDRYRISQEIAHWMAVLAMEQYGYFLADNTGAKLTREIRKTKDLEVFLPYHALLKDDSGIGHSWDYTSDSIAALVSSKLDTMLIKVTNIDGIILNGKIVEEISADDLLKRHTCIDQGSLHLLKSRSCWVLNGSNPDVFITMFKNGKGGTIVRG